MDFNVNNLVRSAVVLVVGLPITVASAVSLLPEQRQEMTASEAVELKASLELPCLKFALTKRDSKGEREAKDAIDEAFGDGASYGDVCKWALS